MVDSGQFRGEEIVGVAALLEQRRAISSGHFVYASGKHGDLYINKNALYPDPEILYDMFGDPARAWKDKRVQAVIGAAVAAPVLAYTLALQITRMNAAADSVKWGFAEKVDGTDNFALKRGYDELVRGQGVLIVEDVATTGGTIRKVAQAIRDAGGKVLGAVAIINRGGITAEMLELPAFSALHTVKFDSWSEADCPFCRDGVSVNTNLGHGAAYLAKKAADEERARIALGA